MEQRTLIIALVLSLALALVLVSAAGCQIQQGANAQASELDSQLNDLNNMDNELDQLNIDEMSDSELDELEGLL